MPERNLLTSFITSPREPDITIEFQQFKTNRSKSKRIILYKFQPPPIKQREQLRSIGPRFAKELPEPLNIELIRSKPSVKSFSKSPNNEAEFLIEEMIRNRQDISLPNIEKPLSPYKNLKERFIKTRSQFENDKNHKCETLLQTIKENIRSKSYRIEDEMNY